MSNCYRHLAQILLFQIDYTPVIILSQDGVTQGEPLLMVLYSITLVPLAEELRDSYPTLLSPFYDDGASFDGLVRQGVAQLKLIIARATDGGYFPDLANSLFISDKLDYEEAEKQDFGQAGLNLNYVGGI